jgi:signal peptidase I
VKTIANWSFFALVILVVWFVAGPTRLGGPASYVIVDGRSMEPTYQDGDLVIAKARANYDVGDTIVYDAPVDHQFNVIHRIVAPTDGGFITQGDNRNEPDGWVAPHEAIHGAAEYHIPNGGALITFLRQPAVILALLSGLLAFEILKRREQAPVIATVDDASTEPRKREEKRTR